MKSPRPMGAGCRADATIAGCRLLTKLVPDGAALVERDQLLQVCEELTVQAVAVRDVQVVERAVGNDGIDVPAL